MAYAARKRNNETSGRITHQYNHDGKRFEIEIWLEAPEADTGYQGCEDIEELKLVALFIDGKWQRLDRDNKQIATLADFIIEQENKRLDCQKAFGEVIRDAKCSYDDDGPDPDAQREHQMDLFESLGRSLRLARI